MDSLVIQCPEGFPSSAYCECSQSPHQVNPQTGLCSCGAHSLGNPTGLTPQGRGSVSHEMAPPSSGLLTVGSAKSQGTPDHPACNAGFQDYESAVPSLLKGEEHFWGPRDLSAWEMLTLRAWVLQSWLPCPCSPSLPSTWHHLGTSSNLSSDVTFPRETHRTPP